MIGTYIKELLKNQNRVIVPDLGAFLRKNDNPDLLYFNEFLRFNDGLLVDYLAEKENIDKIEAAKQIKNFVADVNAKLKDKQTVELKEIGSLYLDNNDKIQLKIDLLKVYNPEENQTPPPTEKPKKKEIKETKIEIQEQTKTVIDKPLVTSEISEKITIPEEPIIKETIINIKKSDNQDINESKQKEFFKSEPVSNPDLSDKKSSGKTMVWIMLIILIVIVLILIWFYLIKPKYFGHNNEKNTSRQDSTVVISGPPVNNVDTININTKNEPKVNSKKLNNKTQSVPISIKPKTNKMYYVVVGCFAMETNADNLIRKLNEKGYQAEKFAKIDDMYFVSIGSFNDEQSANTEMFKIKNSGIPCWLKRY